MPQRTYRHGGPRIVAQGRRAGRVSLRRVLWSGAEVAVTLGVVLLLLVVHQLWWTNRQAKADARDEVRALERQWEGAGEGEGGLGAGVGDPGTVGTDGGGDPDDLDPSDPHDAPRDRSADSGGPGTRGRAATPPRHDQAYAILAIPRLGLRVPVAQGISKAHVLDHGYAGHYPGTAQPGRAGNFAVAGHRNTHGEPFRYIDRLRRGDTLTVRTGDATYTYVVDQRLRQTSAGDAGVIGAVPRSRVVPGAGYSEPGYYLTLTTCTPEFTSRYRLVVWGKLSRMTPR
ncbi:class E sortase [Streptomyces sp. NPDC102406]|uniref:class E sortase n=1 Tax=Streptomyces sp. NPDC102406 TaxID=3366171 RepID=UPI00382673C4